MAYKISSPEEQAYVDLLNQNDQAIWNVHKQRNIPLEDAFQIVTGKPWLEGRSIKFVGGTKGNTGNGFEVTKDRTVKSVLGKYVAPIAGGALAALTAGGALPGLAAMFGGGGGASAAGAGSTLLGEGGTAAGLSTAGMTPGLIGATTAVPAAATAGSRIAGLLKNPMLGDIASGLGDMADQSATNRQVEQAAAAAGPATDAAALRNLERASYVASGGYKPSTENPVAGLESFAGKSVPSFSFAPTGSTPEESAFASQMRDELLKRMREGQPLTLSGIKPAGKLEKAAGIAAPAIGIGKRIASLLF